MSKADYVRDKIATDDGAHQHHCHWPGCDKTVPPATWGCRKHWYMLPAALRSLIWRTFRPGQEDAKTPSREYVDAARKVQDWIAENHPPEPQQASFGFTEDHSVGISRSSVKRSHRAEGRNFID